MSTPRTHTKSYYTTASGVDETPKEEPRGPLSTPCFLLLKSLQEARTDTSEDRNENGIESKGDWGKVTAIVCFTICLRANVE